MGSPQTLARLSGLTCCLRRALAGSPEFPLLKRFTVNSKVHSHKRVRVCHMASTLVFQSRGLCGKTNILLAIKVEQGPSTSPCQALWTSGSPPSEKQDQHARLARLCVKVVSCHLKLVQGRPHRLPGSVDSRVLPF